jgi:aminomethyltransferase
MPAESLRVTPLNSIHRGLGAKMVDFGGWDMPVQYTGILDEHRAVRTAAGLFDVSHMGEIEIRGPEAELLTSYVTTNAVARLKLGQIQYAALLYENGGVVDDILVHKVAADHFFLCVNASNQEKDFDHIRAHNRFNAEGELSSARYAQLALQGPLAAAILAPFTPLSLKPLRYYWFADDEVMGVPARIARTGYTGEDGFEIYVAPEHAPRIWNALLEAGGSRGLKPCGLGARNTLRLEAAMALYGHELDAATSPWDANLGWIVKLDKGDFVGRDALVERQARGLTQQLAGFRMQGRAIARDGYPVLVGGVEAGRVTSGSPSPTLGGSIGFCQVPVDAAAPGTAIEVVVRGRPEPAIIVGTPFYKRSK